MHYILEKLGCHSQGTYINCIAIHINIQTKVSEKVGA